MTGMIRITERSAADVTILELDGRLVLDEGDLPFRNAVDGLVRRGRVKILVDMRKVTRIDSAGIGMLVAKFITAYMRGGRMKLLNLTNRGETLIDMTKLHTVFEIFESEDDAIRSFAQNRPSPLLPPNKTASPEP